MDLICRESVLFFLRLILNVSIFVLVETKNLIESKSSDDFNQ